MVHYGVKRWAGFFEQKVARLGPLCTGLNWVYLPFSPFPGAIGFSLPQAQKLRPRFCQQFERILNLILSPGMGIMPQYIFNRSNDYQSTGDSKGEKHEVRKLRGDFRLCH